MFRFSGNAAANASGEFVTTASSQPATSVAPPVQPPKTFEGCVGRLIRGRSESDFESLTNDPTRKVVFLMDSGGLQKLDGKSGYQQLIHIGHTPEHILEETQSKGNRNKLVSWPKDVGPGVSAT